MVTATLLITLGCNKASNTKPVKNPEVMNKTLYCSPWRDAADAPAAATDLNQIGVCNASICGRGTTTHGYSTNIHIVKNSSGSNWLFTPGTVVTIANQNAIWSNAMSQAIAATPGGFTVSRLYNFRAEMVGFPYFNYCIKFDIEYIKCTTGGGDSNT